MTPDQIMLLTRVKSNAVTAVPPQLQPGQITTGAGTGASSHGLLAPCTCWQVGYSLPKPSQGKEEHNLPTAIRHGV
jgi:hypothetical protein